LVVGGSQGAQALNETVPQALALIKDIQVRHQTGAAMLEAVKEVYRKQSVQAEASAFIEDMAAAYRWADMAICRAGAMTVSELAASALPSILIPFPHAIDDHQTANARFLAESGAARLLPQTQMTVQSLVDAVDAVRQNLQVMGEAALSCARPDATEKVAAYCIQEAEK
jgi:UDP-N-acetylglucosamine--N-acetylmuramyl-(pentapeptide) pyrophosphoryl-undecaprenol N-acetylglucosamine transferase